MNDAWFYRVGETQLGPVPTMELQRLIGTGQVGPSIAIWRDGLPGWVPASNVPGLVPPGWGPSHAPGLQPPPNGLHFLVPTGQTSKSSMAAGYLGLFGIFFFPFGPAALVLGILGVRDLKKHPEKNGWGRAITGIILGGLTTLVILWILVMIIVK